MMAEHDNAGFPLTYCLLSTATALHVHKRRNALHAWAKCLREKYGVTPRFAHTDKDMAEIGMLRDTWELKLQLCWWHMKDAIKKRLAKAKLSTSPYNAERAHKEFYFIDKSFMPLGNADFDEHEGGEQDDDGAKEVRHEDRPNGITIWIPLPPKHDMHGSPNAFRIPSDLGKHDAAVNHTSNPLIGAPTPAPSSSLPRRIKLLLAPNVMDENGAVAQPSRERTVSKEDDEHRLGEHEQQTFCPLDLRDPIIKLIEAHFCAHPLIPGYSAPTPEGIRAWAVKQMYEFCYKYNLREAWAYLWENWYRPGRWELWARSCNPEIPVLKTTMMLESQLVYYFVLATCY